MTRPADVEPSLHEGPSRGDEAAESRSVDEIFVSVIVCTRNRAALLAACLESLAEQTIPADQYEVIVVENACTDHTSRVAERFVRAHRNFRTAREPQPGKSRASNTGLRHARGSHVAFIDDDARAPRPWLEQIASAFSTAAPRPVVVAGAVRSVYERPLPAWWEPATAPDDRGPGFLEPGWDLYRVFGSNVAFDKRVLLECGGFAEGHGPVGERFRLGEDTEAVSRVAALHPYVWYDPAIVVDHWEPARKMTLRYRIWRTYLHGVAISEIEGTVLLSARSLAALLALARKPWAGEDRDAAAGAARRALPGELSGSERRTVSVSLVHRALWLAERVGRVRGARLWR